MDIEKARSRFLSVRSIFMLICQSREDSIDTSIPLLALTLEDEFVGHSICEQGSILLASNCDIDVETAAILEADSGCITIAETLQDEYLISLAGELSDVVVIFNLAIEDFLADVVGNGDVTGKKQRVAVNDGFQSL